jgi:hypothetical protein
VRAEPVLQPGQEVCERRAGRHYFVSAVVAAAAVAVAVDNVAAVLRGVTVTVAVNTGASTVADEVTT